jgi:hypothetical protein
MPTGGVNGQHPGFDGPDPPGPLPSPTTPTPGAVKAGIAAVVCSAIVSGGFGFLFHILGKPIAEPHAGFAAAVCTLASGGVSSAFHLRKRLGRCLDSRRVNNIKVNLCQLAEAQQGTLVCLRVGRRRLALRIRASTYVRTVSDASSRDINPGSPSDRDVDALATAGTSDDARFGQNDDLN